MHPRIWEDQNAMKIVSVLGYLLNDEGKIIGEERTEILCKLMPSIHTLTHRAIIAMLIVGLDDQDAAVFYKAKGLIIINEWIRNFSCFKQENEESDKFRVEMYSQIRAMLRILDVNVQSVESRKQNSFLLPTIERLVEVLDAPGTDYVMEWNSLTKYRKELQAVCDVQYLDRNYKANNLLNQSKFAKVSHEAEKQIDAKKMNWRQQFNPSPASNASKSAGNVPKIPVLSVLNYQPKAFMQRDKANENNEQDGPMIEETAEEEDDDENLEPQIITNVSQTLLSASLDQKIRAQGHSMMYGERSHCHQCRRMNSKRCRRCGFCVKCSQKDRCSNENTPDGLRPSENLSVKDRNQQVLGSAMDQAIYRAFKQGEFHSIFSLLQNDMDVNFRRIESDHSTALMAAAHHGRQDAANKLLSLGANPCIADKNGHEAWFFAERKGHEELTDMLKKKSEEWKSKTSHHA